MPYIVIFGCHLRYISPLHIAILTNSSILFTIIVYFRQMLKKKKKKEMGTIFKTLQLLFQNN
jgi:hypothetical protein